MKRFIALIAALIMVFSLAACSNGSSTADQAEASDISTYSADFAGLQKYISDRNSGTEKQEIYYSILGAKDGIRLVLSANNPCPYVEIYDFGEGATADSASAAVTAIYKDVRDDGKFKPVPDGTEMKAVVTDSGRYIIAWDNSRSFDYEKKAVTDELKKKW